ncbi:MAG: 3-methyl-2-oxobutanoate dehydrogenase [Planctomycetes bacterium]|nr:3-methyl-2-oxobutanoate dehydrogenase [Planctomycetota bacterium]
MTEQLLSVLGADGAVKRKNRPSLTDEDLLLLHRIMVRTRALDERAMLLQRQGRIGFYVPSFGEEAAYVGSALALDGNDWISQSYRQPGVALLRGITAETMLDNCFGNADDIAKGRQMPVHYSFRKANMLSISSPIGTQIVHATGIAQAMKIRGDGGVCLTYFGDGGTSANDFHTGLNFAGAWKSPCIFACINNQWAISCPLERQTGSKTIAEKSAAYGMPGVLVDGNDVLAVYEATRKAVARARDGDGPTLLEFLSFRMGPHSSSDDPSRYRPGELEAEWKKKDPIKRFEAFLTKESLLDKEQIEAIHAEAEAEMSEAAKVSEKKPAPTIDSLFDDVYADMPPHLADQREELRGEGSDHRQDADAAFPL